MSSDIVEERLTRGRVQVLRQRVDSQRIQLNGHRLAEEGMTKENLAIAQEVDLFANAFERVITDNHRLRDENHDLRSELATLKANGSATP